MEGGTVSGIHGLLRSTKPSPANASQQSQHSGRWPTMVSTATTTAGRWHPPFVQTGGAAGDVGTTLRRSTDQQYAATKPSSTLSTVRQCYPRVLTPRHAVRIVNSPLSGRVSCQGRSAIRPSGTRPLVVECRCSLGRPAHRWKCGRTRSCGPSSGCRETRPSRGCGGSGLHPGTPALGSRHGSVVGTTISWRPTRAARRSDWMRLPYSPHLSGPSSRFARPTRRPTCSQTSRGSMMHGDAAVDRNDPRLSVVQQRPSRVASSVDAAHRHQEVLVAALRERLSERHPLRAAPPPGICVSSIYDEARPGADDNGSHCRPLP